MTCPISSPFCRAFLKRSAYGGFTLAELLIALAILGVIATFTIPKVLSSQQDSQAKAVAKDIAATISSGYQAYRLNKGDSSDTEFADITPYLNYVKVLTDSASQIDATYGFTGTIECDSGIGRTCLLLHNGSVLMYFMHSFGGTASTNALLYYFDPDGKPTSSGNASGPGKSVNFQLYYSGRIRDGDNVLPNTCNSFSCQDGEPNPPWFNWN